MEPEKNQRDRTKSDEGARTGVSSPRDVVEAVAVVVVVVVAAVVAAIAMPVSGMVRSLPLKLRGID